MNTFKTILIFSFLAFVLSCGSNKVSTNQKNELASNEIAKFPEDFMGEWTGYLSIYGSKGLHDKIEMGLNIVPIENSKNLTFMIRYGEDKEENKRNYELVFVDKEKGLFKIDEKNTILMEAYYIGGKLFQTFEVGGNLLTSTLSKIGDQLLWEITSGKLEPVSNSGDQMHEGEEIPEVKVYPMRVYQKGVLSKKS